MEFNISNTDIHDFFISSFDKKTTHSTGSHLIFNLCSISKLVTSILFLKMLQKNKLNLEDLVKVSNNSSFSIEILLRHLSGIQDNEQLFLAGNTLKPNSLLDDINIQNSGEFNYSDHGYMLLQFWLERNFNCSFENLVKEEIFELLNLKNMYYVQNKEEINKTNFAKGYDKNNHLIPSTYSIYPFSAACGLWGSGENLLTLIKEICDGINGYSKLGISQNNYHQLIQADTYDWLGLGCFLEENSFGLEVSSLGWGEGYQSMVVFYPKLRKGLIVLTNRDLGVHQMKGFCGDIYKQWVTTL